MGEAIAHFTTLGDDECRELLRTSAVGRLGWESTTGPQILPVAYAVRGDHVYFCTAPGSALAELRTGARVALQVDELDPGTRTGWSVLARGTTSSPADPDTVLRELGDDAPRPWVAADRTLVIRVAIDDVAGRVLAADD